MFKTRHQKQVEDFMRLAEQDLPDEPCKPSLEVRHLRAKLIFEEAIETIHALGFGVVLKSELYTPVVDVEFEEETEFDLEEVIDGCCDLAVVTTGTLSACGVPDALFQEEVNHNNLEKFGPGHKIREDGKLIKPPDHKPPNIKGVLEFLKLGMFMRGDYSG